MFCCAALLNDAIYIAVLSPKVPTVGIPKVFEISQRHREDGNDL
jgi:hypothetical protein